MARRLGFAVAVTMLASPVLAQSVAPPLPDTSSPEAAAAADWQGVIHNQVQAFRDHDAAAALSYASAAFHDQFKDPQAFFVAIMSAGYSPIMESRSESFGPYEMMAPNVVDQDVKFVGTDQNLYEAIYRLQKETDGWRVEAVQLVKTPGVGV